MSSEPSVSLVASIIPPSDKGSDLNLWSKRPAVQPIPNSLVRTVWSCSVRKSVPNTTSSKCRPPRRLGAGSGSFVVRTELRPVRWCTDIRWSGSRWWPATRQGLVAAIGAACRGGLAAPPHPLHDQPDGDHPESSWPWVRTSLHSIFDQPGT